ncbi:MAG: peptide chain release factor N(5)-glutamine methyltransferase [Chlamydia sp.]
MKEMREVVRLAKLFVASKENGRPHHEVELFIAEKLGLASRLDLYLYYDKPIVESELVTLRSGLKKLAEGEPLAYILGKADFYGHAFYVSPDVLIPRPETECLVTLTIEEIARIRQLFPKKRVRLLDLCSGSGCIGISLKKAVPELDVDLSDISCKALAVAKKNSEIHEVSVRFIESDLFSKIDLSSLYDVIISNPPYLSQKEMEGLDFSVGHFEPPLALFGGISGVEIYDQIARDLHHALAPAGLFLCEIGVDQASSVSQILKNHGFLDVEVYQDYQGRDRIVTCRKKK